MDLHHLKLFHIVARNLSFSKTAEELHISQPAISMQIKNLEQQLGFKLIERYGRSIFLSREGHIIYSYTQKVFELINEMEAEVTLLKGRMSGKIRIGASNTPGVYILPQIMGTFKDKHPDVILNLDIGNTQQIQDKLVHDELDFAVVGGEVDLHKAFTVEKLVEDTMVVIASPSNTLSHTQFVEANMLSNQQYIAHDETSQLYKSMERIVTKLKLPYNVIMTLGNVEAIKHAVAANLGISIVPYTCAYSDIEMGILKHINIENKVWKYPYNLVYHNKKTFSAPIIIMLEMMRSHIKRIVTG